MRALGYLQDRPQALDSEAYAGFRSRPLSEVISSREQAATKNGLLVMKGVLQWVTVMVVCGCGVICEAARKYAARSSISEKKVVL